MYDVVVIGGGAAGMLAASVAAKHGAKVLLFERNDRLGRKLIITGKGRCNLTNDCSASEILANIPNGHKFLYSALNGFPPSHVISLFESLGVSLKTERGRRVFPASDKASDIVDALRDDLKRSGVSVRTKRVLDVFCDDGNGFSVVSSGSETNTRTIIVATGGMSYPATGSTGDGFELAKKLGHTVTELRGSLVPLVAEPELCVQMQGLTLKNVRLSVYDGSKKPIFADLGELLFTHFGLSGPLALSASAHMRDFSKKKYHVLIDLKPGLDEKKLDLRILRDFEKYKSRDFANALGDLLNRSIIPIVIEKSGIPPGKKVHSISREERRALVLLLKAFRIEVDGPRPVEEAIITSGGITLSEINPKTMESKLVSGLYFAGEIIDADAYTGGYNLQIAWSTGFAAGSAAANAD
ncbi:MAG: NAD(P)/FAD-dependent oxidoreductase [Oscillospiraceae bacterium]|nr:NAD(P)/FAD-dependent oxidoreductase [Oscillospiraceae bacterium]